MLFLDYIFRILMILIEF